jgi:hypothetical protein
MVQEAQGRRGVSYSLEKLAGLALGHAKGVLVGVDGAQLIPTFHIQFINRPPVIMATPWQDDREKAMVVASVRALLKAFRPSVDSYSFMSEAWIATQTTPPRASDLQPSQREDRKEAVIITCFNKDKGFMRAYEIKRDAQARVTELTPEKEGAACDRFEGRLYNLFEEP